MALKALLFDLDGTLIDSEFFHFECWNEILAEFDVQLTYADWLKTYAGVPLPTNAARLVEKYNITAPLPQIIDKRERLTLERLKTKDVNLMPHVAEVLEYFKSKNLTLALVTSSPRQDVDAVFERNGLGRYFKLIITRTEVTKSKPDPESYLVCVEKLGVLKKECLVFEDTINGVKSAKAAGLICFAIQSNTDEHHKLTIADKLFLDFKAAKDHLIEQGFIA
ncbi:HAD family hydrolase [Mucilaginibacter lappiensis]|uniref:HAD superfamily hydrolase (TIGR01509 family) n=1 Tax=Mucilaginibacter lappiensis TaxID=354630 RepID=A0A841JBX5_9SPHI|nr:HAD family phosphatase [Mucilaginibacter lappiensis]MBB6128134.1 HAD superfamily hydrolase (TIGR01509 family) [Mucilaginibacter lappiensis]